MTAFIDMDTTIQAMKSGAFEYINKPINIDELNAVIGKIKGIIALKRSPLGPLSDEFSSMKIGNIVGKTPQMLQIFKTIAIASEKTGAIVNDYTAAPVYFSDDNNGAHEWLIEFEKEPNDLETFTFELDAALQKTNSDYEAKRYKNIALRAPVIRKLNKGIFAAWLKSKGKLGGQHKVPRLSNDRKYLEEILQFIS